MAAQLPYINHPLFGRKTCLMIQDIDDALALGIAYAGDIIPQIGARSFNSAEEWQTVDAAFCVVLDCYRNLLRQYADAMAEKPRFYKLDYDYKRMSGFVAMPDFLVREFQGQSKGDDDNQMQFALLQIFNYMSAHAKDTNRPLADKLPDNVSERPHLREARNTGIRYATQYWMSVIGRVFAREKAVSVSGEYGLPQVVDEKRILPEISAAAKRGVERLKGRIDGLAPNPFHP